MVSQIIGVSMVYPTVCSGADKRKHQSSASLAFARGIHQCPVSSPHKVPVTQKTFTFDNIIMFMLFFPVLTSSSFSISILYAMAFNRAHRQNAITHREQDKDNAKLSNTNWLESMGAGNYIRFLWSSLLLQCYNQWFEMFLIQHRLRARISALLLKLAKGHSWHGYNVEVRSKNDRGLFKWSQCEYLL